MKIKLGFVLAMIPLLCLDHAHGGVLKKYFFKDDQQRESVAHIEGSENTVTSESKESSVDVSNESNKEIAKQDEHAHKEIAPSTDSSLDVTSTPSTPEVAVPEKKKEIIGDPVVLRIGRVEFKRSQILADVKLIPPQLLKSIPADRLFGMLLDQKMSTFLMVEQSKKAGMDRTKEYIEKLEHLKNELLARMYLMKEITPKTENESALKGEYERYKAEFKKGKEHQLWHIMLANEEDAKSVIDTLTKGEDFSKLAKEKSLAPSKDNGGDEGYIQLEMLPSNIKEKLLTLRKGEFLKEPIKVGTTFHVFKIGDSRDTAPQKYEEIKDMLKQMIVQKTIMELITKLEKQYQVEKFNEDGSPYVRPTAPMAVPVN